ncbi:CAP domain-containing protein [Demequina aurantiaca]|uniref:CAP domain-containing protein n=1 Tax=Demequina aurantiaca TaxID=676200 RepID=UPI003D3415B4
MTSSQPTDRAEPTGRSRRWWLLALGAVVAVIAAALMGVAVATLFGGSGGREVEPSPEPSARALSPDGFARELFDLTNAEREGQGVAPLEWSDCVAAAAAPRALVAANAATLGHEVLVASCHLAATAGENLSRSDRAPAQVVEAWMGSAGHRANLVNEEFLIAGVVCVRVADTTELACAQLFEGD